MELDSMTFKKFHLGYLGVNKRRRTSDKASPERGNNPGKLKCKGRDKVN
jgi:hypothetical protein